MEDASKNKSELSLKDYWELAMPYSTFRELLRVQSLNGSTSGDLQSDALIDYTRLNDRRTARWEKRLDLPELVLNSIRALRTKQNWLVLNESWCGDAAHSLPVMNRFAELSEYIELRVLWRDQHLDLMDRYTSGGSRGIPKLLILNENFELTGEWGSRPRPLQEQVDQVKSEFGKIPAEFKETIQQWYNKDKGLTTANELIQLLPIYAEINR